MLNEAYQADKALFREVEHPEVSPSLIDVTEDAARFRANTVLTELLEPLQIKKKPKTVTRDKFIKKIGTAWVPDSQEKAILAANGALFTISELYQHAPKDKKVDSIKDRYVATVDYANEAFDAMNLLHEGYEVNPTRGSFPDAKTIKDNPAVLAELAKFFVSRQHLDEYKWKENAERLEIVTDYLEHASPAMLEQIHFKVFQGKRAEYNFWVKQNKKAQGNKTVQALVNDPKGNLPRIRTRQSNADEVDDAKLLKISEDLATRRLAEQRRPEGDSYDKFIPEEAREAQRLIWDDKSAESIKMRNLEDGSGMSSYGAQLNILGIKAAGKAVPMVRQERFRGSKPPVRGSLQRLTADTPEQKVQDQQPHPGELDEITGRTAEERLIASDGLRQLGAVLPHEPLRDSPDKE
jgi:hypothetical protein